MRRIRLLILLCTLGCMTSCNIEDTNPYPKTGAPVKFEIEFFVNMGTESKVTTSDSFISTWESGDAIGIYVVRGDGTLQASANYADNVKLTYDDNVWSASSPIYYPTDGDKLHFYAYYPYDEDMDPTDYTFAATGRSDLMIAKKEGVEPGDTPVSLAFAHIFSLVQVEVVKGDNIPEFDENLTVTLANVLPDITLSWEDAISATGTSTDIVMNKVDGMDNTFRALLPAQTLGADTKVTIVQNTAGSEIDMEYIGIQSAVLEAGNVHKYRVTLSPFHEYAIGDLYPHTGTTIGVVFWVNPDNKYHGKIVSLDEGRELKWSTNTTTTANTTMDNGLANMNTVYALNNTYLPHHAFLWVDNKNGGGTTNYDKATGVWYFPSIEELRVLAAGYNGKIYEEIIGWKLEQQLPDLDEECEAAREAFDAKLIIAGGTGLATSDHYWSSSEYDGNRKYPWYIHLEIGYTNRGISSIKDTEKKVRAIMAF